MTKSALIIIGGGILSTYAIRRARALGYHTICTDRDPDCMGAAEADEFQQADVYSVNEQVVAALKCHARHGTALKGIFVGGIDAAHIAASVAHIMGWPGCNPQAAWLCRRKDLFRQRMKEKGVRQPEFWVTTPDGDVLLDPNRPFIVKSVENSGGRGHTLLDPFPPHWPRDFTRLNDALVKAAQNNIGGARDVLVEERLAGREFSVEILADPTYEDADKLFYFDGLHRPLNIVERYFATDSPYPIEVGHVNPAPITKEQADKLYALAKQCAAAVFSDWGVFKIDAIWPTDSAEPYVLEATCRWSGGFDSQETTPAASGRDFLGFGVRLAAGEPVSVNDPALQPRWQRAAASWCPVPPPMVLDHIDTVGAMRVPGVEKVLVMPFATAGAQISVVDSSTRPVYVIASGNTTEEALKAAKEASSKVRFIAR